MSDQEFKYDVFLSHASEDTEWCLRLAERLRDEGVRVWFDKWELQPGSHLEDRINDGLESSRKMVAVWTKNYFADHKAWTLAESYARQHADILSRDRLLIPALREDCRPKPLQAPLIPIDFRNDSDFDIRVRTLIESLDLPRRDFIERDEELELAFREHDPRRLGAERPRGKIFEEEVARLYRLLGYEVEGVEIGGVRIGLQVQKRQGGRTLRDIVACVHPFVTGKERDQMLHHQFLAQKKFANHGLIAVAQSFDAKARAELEDAQITCATHADLLSELLPLGDYANGLIAEYEREVDDQWQGEDRFIRPDIETDAGQQTMPALKFFGKWLGDGRRNLVVLLGDLGMGKSTLSKFLAYNLARSYNADPIRHPAPVLIPLTKLYKEASLNSIVTGHFGERGINNINFNAFQHLAREGRLVIIFDAFDEMADRMVWRETLGNFLTLVRAAEGEAKVLITCRTHYFKDHDDQAEVIGEAARTLEEITRKFKSEKALFKAARENQAEVIYLREFDDDQVREYLSKARRGTAAEDWVKIEQTYDLGNLAQRPLLLNMIIESLDRFGAGEKIDAAQLYERYTDKWINREYNKGRVNLRRREKLAMMMELARMMWREDKSAVRYRELLPFVERLVGEGKIELKDQEVEEIAGEIHNASFLKRNEAGEFSFMHRSLMEFFLARKLRESLATPDAFCAALDTRRFDQKMIFFFEKLDSGDAALEPLRQILTGGYQPRSSENALQLLYWTARHRAGMEKEITKPEVLRRALADRIPTGVKLAGAQLQEAALECVELPGADLAGADLTKAKLNHARLDRADLRKATLVNARFDNALAIGADFREAGLEGASFNEARLDGSDFSGAETNRASFVNAGLDRAKGITRPPAPRKTLDPIVQRGHGAAVRSVAYSPDGELMASGGDDGLILIRRASDGKLLRALEGHTDSVGSVAFAHDGATLASGSSDNSVRLWELKSGKLLRALEGHTDSVGSVAFAHDGATLASGSSDHSVRLWELKSGKLIRALEGHTSAVGSVAFAHDGATLASGSSDNSVRLWELKSGKLLRALEGHTDSVRSVAFAHDGATLASGSSDNSVRLWELKSGKLLRALEGHTDSVGSVAFAHDGATLASGSSDHSVRLWELKSGKLIRALEGHTSAVGSVAFAHDGATLASGSDDQSVRLWELKSGKLLRALEGHTDSVRSVAFAHDGATLASGSRDNSVRLWELKSGKLLRALAGHTSDVWSVAFAHDGATLASGSSDKSVRLWEVKSGKLIRALAGHTSYVWSVAFAHDGATLASGSSDNSVRLWELKSGKLIRALEGHTADVWSVAFAHDGATLASGSSDKSVRLWEVKSGKLIRALAGHTSYVWSVAFAHDGATLASGSYDNSVRLWEVKSGKLLRALAEHTDSVFSVAFAHDGATLASGSDDKSVRLWEVKSGKCLMELTGNLGAVQAVAIAPNGKYLVAAGAAGRLQFWDLATGQTFLYSYDFGEGAWLTLLPDGRFDASPEGLRYLSFTEEGTNKSYDAEELAKEFYRPEDVRAVLEKYTK